MSPSGYLPKFERMLRLPGKVTLRHHQMLRLPRKITVQCVTQIIWCIIYNDGWFNHIENNLTMEVQNWTCPFPELTFSFSNALYGQVRHVALRQSTTIWPRGAPAKKSDTRTSPKAAPATKSHAPTSPWQPVPRKGTLKHHQMSRLPRKVTVQYCACHTIHTICDANGMKGHYNGGGFETDPRMMRTWSGHLAPTRSPWLCFALRTRILHWKIQHMARVRRKSDAPTSPNAAPATKHDTPTSPNVVPAATRDTQTSPNVALATKSAAPTSVSIARKVIWDVSDVSVVVRCKVRC